MRDRNDRHRTWLLMALALLVVAFALWGPHPLGGSERNLSEAPAPVFDGGADRGLLRGQVGDAHSPAPPTPTPTAEPVTPTPTVGSTTMPAVEPEPTPTQIQNSGRRETTVAPAAPVFAGSCMAAASVYDWPLWEVQYVMDHESFGGDPYALNRSSGACGCMQTLPCVGHGDPATNMAAAYAKWLDGGGSFYAHWYRWWN